MQRVCRVCGGVYRGLVCQTCHPRGCRRRAEDEWRAVFAPLRTEPATPGPEARERMRAQVMAGLEATDGNGC